MVAGHSSMVIWPRMVIWSLKSVLLTKLRQRAIHAVITQNVSPSLELNKVISLVEHMENHLRKR